MSSIMMNASYVGVATMRNTAFMIAQNQKIGDIDTTTANTLVTLAVYSSWLGDAD